MDARKITAAAEADQAGVLGTLALAFAADPVMRWLYPTPRDYLASFPPFLLTFGGGAFTADTVWSLEDFAAVAMWLPPGVELDGEAIVDHLTGTVAPDQHDELYAVLEGMDAAHPTEPVWYLPWFGVDNARQGTGLGSALMTTCLETVDADHLPAYLETPNPRNISFYRRHGFEVTGEVTSPTCPPVTFMLRPAR